MVEKVNAGISFSLPLKATKTLSLIKAGGRRNTALNKEDARD